jgi:hypothetical protein
LGRIRSAGLIQPCDEFGESRLIWRCRSVAAPQDQGVMPRKIFLKKFMEAVDGCAIRDRFLIPPDGGDS